LRVLVTGGAGFIGSHVVDKLIAAGHEPRIVDLVATPYQAAGAVESVVGDLVDPETATAAVSGCDAVMHLAAMADVNQVAADPVGTDRVNVRGTLALLEAARAAGIERFCYASTVWVYGNAPGPEPHDEETPLVLPPHLYTASKLAGEMYCHAYEALYSLPSTILRFGIPYGPRARPAAVVPAFIARASAGEALTIAGDGSQARQFVYVEDLAEGMVASLAPVGAGRIYNLVSEESVSVRQIADTVRELVAPVPIVHGPERPADLRIGTVSGARAATELGWTAPTRFIDGVRRYLDWLTVTSGSPVASAASITDGNARAVLRQEPAEL
jgi:UDP-glucose 4-epimerase